MISSKYLQNLYNKFYKYFMEYIWDFDVVELVVDLEMKIYQTCPDLAELKSTLDKLNIKLRQLVPMDSEVMESLNKISDEVVNSEDVYTKLNKVNEVV